jgi:hypothetical protein
MARSVRPSVGNKPIPPVAPSEAVVPDWLALARLPSWPGAAGSSTSRPKIRLQSHHRALRIRSAGSRAPEPVLPLAPSRLPPSNDCRTAGRRTVCQGFPPAASPALTARRRPRCRRVVPRGGAAHLRKEQGTARPPPLLTGGVQIGGKGTPPPSLRWGVVESENRIYRESSPPAPANAASMLRS